MNPWLKSSAEKTFVPRNCTNSSSIFGVLCRCFRRDLFSYRKSPQGRNLPLFLVTMVMGTWMVALEVQLDHFYATLRKQAWRAGSFGSSSCKSSFYMILVHRNPTHVGTYLPILPCIGEHLSQADSQFYIFGD